MNRIEELSNWITKIEKDGIPQNEMHKKIWGKIIHTITTKIKNNESWESIENYIKTNKDSFSNKKKIESKATFNIFNQVSTKMWSIKNS